MLVSGWIRVLRSRGVFDSPSDGCLVIESWIEPLSLVVAYLSIVSFVGLFAASAWTELLSCNELHLLLTHFLSKPCLFGVDSWLSLLHLSLIYALPRVVSFVTLPGIASKKRENG